MSYAINNWCNPQVQNIKSNFVYYILDSSVYSYSTHTEIKLTYKKTCLTVDWHNDQMNFNL